MSRPPRLPKIDTQNVPNPLSSLQTRPRNAGLPVPSNEIKQPLSAVERGMDMQIPDTPVIVPPTPIGSDTRVAQVDDGLIDQKQSGHQALRANEKNGNAAVDNAMEDNTKEETNNNNNDDPDAGITIFDSPSDEADDISFTPRDKTGPATNDDEMILADSPAGEHDEGSEDELPGWLRKRMEGLGRSPQGDNETGNSAGEAGQGDIGIIHGRDFGIERQNTVLAPIGVERQSASKKNSASNGNAPGRVKNTRARSRSTSPDHHRKSFCDTIESSKCWMRWLTPLLDP